MQWHLTLALCGALMLGLWAGSAAEIAGKEQGRPSVPDLSFGGIIVAHDEKTRELTLGVPSVASDKMNMIRLSYTDATIFLHRETVRASDGTILGMTESAGHLAKPGDSVNALVPDDSDGRLVAHLMIIAPRN